ncbi:MAG: ribosome biogenesis GTPase Der [Aestuariivita sp.]|nr:ribosome biogenesis GTPase Der [Aestuariivita sp.]MCY4347131.1 ribosome biogenesis GTPase Der [Aestuariivita sp.]
MSFSVAIVGRPNVGKSTLFNRLVGKKLALIDDRPGVTRDLREGFATLHGLQFVVFDTAGLEDGDKSSLQARMSDLTRLAIDNTDVTLFLLDARSSVTAADERLAEFLRKRAKHVVVAANKSETSAADVGIIDAFSLGLGEPIRLSAEHGIGFSELHESLRGLAEELDAVGTSRGESTYEFASNFNANIDASNTSHTEEKAIQVAVVGRPNAGKSTLINRIFGQDRLLTGPESGITRDAIALRVNWAGTDGTTIAIKIFDTAGMRRKPKVQEKLEQISVSDGLRAVMFAEVVILLLDANNPLEQQDLRLADLAEREGRAAVIAVNKWDLQRDRQQQLSQIKEKFERLLPQWQGAAVVPVSAKTGEGLENLQKAVVQCHQVWNQRVATNILNSWLSEMVAHHPPPAPNGNRIKLRYITQIKSRPPTFIIMCSHPRQLPASYRRYLKNGLRDDFSLYGTPIRIALRDQGDKNPFKGRKSNRQRG